MIKNITIIVISIYLIGCNKPNDEHVYTLYSSYVNNNRIHVATFDATPVSWKDNNLDKQFIKWASEENFKTARRRQIYLRKTG